MEPVITKPWWKKKRYLIPIGVIALLSFSGDSGKIEPSQKVAPVVQNVQSASYSTNATASKLHDSTQTVNSLAKPTEASLSNDNYYTNTAGNQVHSPAYSNSVPAGASALCRDGTYSFSQSRRGTCSHHGGVSQWL